jgi:general secretion pathway protein H
MRRRRAGLTLLEALATVALASALAGMATAALVALVRGARLAGAARAVATELRLARGLALSGRGPVEVRFDAARGAWEVRDGAGAVVGGRALPAGVTIASLPLRGGVVFRALGTAENGTVTLAAGPRLRRIVVNQRGRVRIQ